MVQADSDTAAADNVRPFPGPTPEPHPQARPKDPTSPIRSKRYRRKRDGRSTVRRSDRDGKSAPGGHTPQNEKQNEIKPGVPVHAPPPAQGYAARTRHGAATVVTAYIAAVALAGAAAFFSIKGMVVIFPGSPVPDGIRQADHGRLAC